MTPAKIFVVAPLNSKPSGGMGVLIQMVMVLNRYGHDVSIIYTDEELRPFNNKSEIKKFELPWLEEDLSAIKIFPIVKEVYTINQRSTHGFLLSELTDHDILVVPEVMNEIIQLTRTFNFKKVILVQSWAFIYQSILNGANWWNDYGYETVICTSEYIRNYLRKLNAIRNVFHYYPSISNEFKPSSNIRALKVCYITRSEENQIYTEFAISHAKRVLRGIDFESTLLRNLPRRVFATVLSQHPVCIFSDTIAGLGTFPLEAMRTHTHCIGFRINAGREYMTKLSGSWVQPCDAIKLGNKLAEVLHHIHHGVFDWEKHIKEYTRISDRYNINQEEKSILSIFDKIISNNKKKIR